MITFKAPRCRSARTLRSKGRRATIRCGLEKGHGELHAKYVVWTEEGRATVARWNDGGPVVLDDGLPP